MSSAVTPAPWAIVAASFHAAVTDRLVDGAMACFRDRSVPEADVALLRVAGAFELPQAVGRLFGAHLAAADRPRTLRGAVALGAVIRGETPHFDHVCTACSGGLMDVACRTGIPVGFGVLTCDTMEQALARAGGDRGQKGYEAAAAVLDLAESLTPWP